VNAEVSTTHATLPAIITHLPLARPQGGQRPRIQPRLDHDARQRVSPRTVLLDKTSSDKGIEQLIWEQVEE